MLSVQEYVLRLVLTKQLWTELIAQLGKPVLIVSDNGTAREDVSPPLSYTSKALDFSGHDCDLSTFCSPRLAISAQLGGSNHGFAAKGAIVRQSRPPNGSPEAASCIQPAAPYA